MAVRAPLQLRQEIRFYLATAFPWTPAYLAYPRICRQVNMATVRYEWALGSCAPLSARIISRFIYMYRTSFDANHPPPLLPQCVPVASALGVYRQRIHVRIADSRLMKWTPWRRNRAPQRSQRQEYSVAVGDER